MAKVIIDGYNLLALSGHKNRDALILHLSTYQKNTGHKVTVVFDGTHQGTGFGSHTFEAGVEIYFSPLTVTADDFIEELLEKKEYAGVVVVSSDRKVQGYAKKAHCTSVESFEFSKKLSTSSRNLQTDLYGGEKDETIYKQKQKKGPSKKLSKKEKKRQKGLRQL